MHYYEVQLVIHFLKDFIFIFLDVEHDYTVSIGKTSSYRRHIVTLANWKYTPGGGGGGGGSQIQRGAAPALRISRKKGSFFKTFPCPRFCKRRVLFCTQIRSMGVKIPLQSTKYTRL